MINKISSKPLTKNQRTEYLLTRIGSVVTEKWDEGMTNKRRTKDEQKTNKRRTKDKQKTNKRRTKNEQRTNKERTKDEQKTNE